MARRKKPNVYDFLDKGTKFLGSFNQTLDLARDFLVTFRGFNAGGVRTGINNGVNNVELTEDEKVRQASYRFMSLQMGCGIEAVKNRFRDMVKEKRPDLGEGDKNTEWFMALRVARETILKYEK